MGFGGGGCVCGWGRKGDREVGEQVGWQVGGGVGSEGRGCGVREGSRDWGSWADGVGFVSADGFVGWFGI